MTGVIPFDFEGKAVRAIDRNGAPWFVLGDVCRVLEVGNVADAARRLDADEKGVDIIDTLGGGQRSSIINESGLYSLILTSRKPAARRFKKWVTSEVLPAIRRTGRYEAPAAVLPSPEVVRQQVALVRECRCTFGPVMARALWLRLGLPLPRALDGAEAVRRIEEMAAQGLGTGAIATEVGRTQRLIQQCLKVARDLAAPAKAALADGRICLSHAKIMSRHAPEVQAMLLDGLLGGDIAGERELTEWGRQLTAEPAP